MAKAKRIAEQGSRKCVDCGRSSYLQDPLWRDEQGNPIMLRCSCKDHAFGDWTLCGACSRYSPRQRPFMKS